MPGFKYGLLILPSREGLAASVRMGDNTELVPAKLDTLMDVTKAKHWREWIGSIEWKQLIGADALVITRIPSETPEVMDGETQQLQARAVTNWFAYLLADPHPFTRGKAWILSGPCAGATPGGRLLDVRSLAREELASPFYSERKEYWDSLGNDVMLRSDDSNAAWPKRSWTSTRCCRSASTRGPSHPARCAPLVPQRGGAARAGVQDARACARGRGSHCATEGTRPRAVPGSGPAARTGAESRSFVGAEVADLLLELYDLRSACVHGKVPFLNLQKLGDAGAVRAAKLSFVAEKLARAALLTALRSDGLDVFATRESLEGAWKEQAFP